MGRRKSMRHSEEFWEIIAGPTDVRCTAHVQAGTRCLRAALFGTTVCRQHGGLIPVVRDKAARRIGNAADEMVQKLHAMLDDPNVEARDKMKIAQDMLDRAGLNATGKLLIGVGEVDPVEALFHKLLSDPSGLAPTIQEPSPQALAWNRAAMDDDDDIVDAELVPEPEPEPEPVTESMSSKPPKHILLALDRLI